MAAHVDEWRPVMAMLLFDLISAVMTALVKEALQQGLNSLVLITLRQLVATVFLAPIAYFKERYLSTWINLHAASIQVTELKMLYIYAIVTFIFFFIPAGT